MRTEHSAGAVLFTLVGGVPHYVLVQEMVGHTGLPKGHMEAGETVAQKALTHEKIKGFLAQAEEYIRNRY